MQKKRQIVDKINIALEFWHFITDFVPHQAVLPPLSQKRNCSNLRHSDIVVCEPFFEHFGQAARGKIHFAGITRSLSGNRGRTRAHLPCPI